MATPSTEEDNYSQSITILGDEPNRYLGEEYNRHPSVGPLGPAGHAGHPMSGSQGYSASQYARHAQFSDAPDADR